MVPSPKPSPTPSPSPARTPSPSASPRPNVGSGGLASLPSLLDIWIIAGQSNAVGYNWGDGQPMPHPCTDSVPGQLLMFPSATRIWEDARASVAYISNGNPTMNSATGPEMNFGRQLISHGISQRVGLIPTAISSTNLFSDWMPPRGPQWQGMLSAVNAAMAAAGPYATLRGMLWVQVRKVTLARGG